MTRYPLEPLATHLGITLGQIGGHQPGQHPTGITALTHKLQLSPTRIYQLRRHGLTPNQADQLAIHTGTHPADIWPTWFEDTPDDLPPAAQRNAARTHCPQGHPYTHIDTHGSRRCRRCARETTKKCRQNRKTAGQPNDYTQPALPGVHNP